MNTTTIPPALLRDLLDPDTDLAAIAERHDLPIPALLEILESDAFREQADMLARAESIRAAALAPVRRERALRTLTTLASQEPTSATHAESVRRAATAILKETRATPADQPTSQPAPNPAARTPPHSPSPPPSAPSPPPTMPSPSSTPSRQSCCTPNPAALPRTTPREHAQHVDSTISDPA